MARDAFTGRFEKGAAPETRFWRYVQPECNSGCWLWSGSANTGGYGLLHVRPATISAHRFSWELRNGPIPEGLCALHRCDTPACVNPDHLFLGTRGDNNRDKASKGRCHDNRGARHGMAKLTEAAAMRILKKAIAGENQRALGARFGISQSAVSNILKGRRWPHLQEQLRCHSS